MNNNMRRWNLQDYHGPLQVHMDVRNRAKCIRLKDGRLHVYETGAFPILLTGPDYILVDHALGKILQASCGQSIQITPIEIINVNSGSSLASYLDVKAAEEITPKTIANVDSSGSRAWHFMNSHLFVTKPVMDAIHEEGISGLMFYPGFRAFVAGLSTD
jgi:hypothetical protein